MVTFVYHCHKTSNYLCLPLFMKVIWPIVTLFTLFTTAIWPGVTFVYHCHMTWCDLCLPCLKLPYDLKLPLFTIVYKGHMTKCDICLPCLPLSYDLIVHLVYQCLPIWPDMTFVYLVEHCHMTWCDLCLPCWPLSHDLVWPLFTLFTTVIWPNVTFVYDIWPGATSVYLVYRFHMTLFTDHRIIIYRLHYNLFDTNITFPSVGSLRFYYFS